MKLNALLILLVFGFTLPSNAATVDTVAIYSEAMKKTFKCVIIQPEGNSGVKNRFPVVYLLHGHGGWYANWLIRVPDLKVYADLHQMMIVCPDGGFNSWYVDSPVDPAVKFETYVGEEVVNYVDSHYPTVKNRKGRAITGLSMGGHGGLFLGFRHAETFGACGSMSGGVDLGPFKKNWQLSEKLGDTVQFADNWKQSAVINIIEKYPKDSLAIIIDCGTEDFFYPVNVSLHEKMRVLKIPHDFIIRPGRHNWDYWGNAIGFQLLFFRNFFRE